MVTGGLAHSGDFFKKGLYRAIRSQVPDIQILEPLLPPVLGAVLLALEMIDPRPSADFIPALLQSGQDIKLKELESKMPVKTNPWRKSPQNLLPATRIYHHLMMLMRSTCASLDGKFPLVMMLWQTS